MRRTIVRGVPKFSDKEAPIPWKKSDLDAELWASRPIRPTTFAAEWAFRASPICRRFIEAGGLFITVAR